MDFLPVDDLGQDAWRAHAGRAPLSIGEARAHVFPPLHGDHGAYVVFVVLGQDHPRIVTAKVTATSNSKLDLLTGGQPAESAPPRPHHEAAAEVVGAVLGFVTDRGLAGTPRCYYNGEVPVMTYPTAVAGRVETLTAQLYIEEVRSGLSGRTPVQQALLRATATVRTATRKDKKVPYSPGAPTPTGYLFPVRRTSTGTPSHMLASAAADTDHLRGAARSMGEWYVMPKLDGMRAFAYVDGGTLVFVSRGGNRLAISKEFESELLPFFADADPGIVLDGELYIHHHPENGRLVRASLGKIKGAVSSYGSNTDAAAKNRGLAGTIEFHVFTATLPGAPDPGALARHGYLADRLPVDALGAPHFSRDSREGDWAHCGRRVWVIPRLKGDVGDLYDQCMAAETEGCMLWDARSPYKPGRSGALWKLKRTETEWVEVVGVEKEESRRAANLKYVYAGRTHVASGAFSLRVQGMFHDDPGVVAGSWALVRYQQVTDPAEGPPALRDPKIILVGGSPEGPFYDLEKMATDREGPPSPS